MKITHCRLCKNDTLELVYDFGASPFGDAFQPTREEALAVATFPLNLVRCDICGHLQLGYTVPPEQLYVRGYLYETSSSFNLDKHFAAYAGQTRELPGLGEGSFAIDVGSNIGTLLYSMQKEGFTVLGVEPSVHTAQKANENGTPTKCAFFTGETAKEIRAQHGKADIITANNIFANVHALEPFMNGVDVLLSESGWFVIETGYGLDLINNIVVDNIYHEHLSYFLCAPLQSFMKQYGFEIIRVQRVATKGGSIRVFCRRQHGDHIPEWNVAALIQMERELGFGGFAPYALFRHTLDVLRDKIIESAEALRKRGNVAAFGASVGGTALLYWLGLTEKDICCLYDDNPIKKHLYSPGLGIEVHPASELSGDMPPSVLNLAWRYLLPVFTKHAAYLEHGGSVLQPLPYPHLLTEKL